MRNNGEGIAIYSRKSKFTGRGESIGNQVELCREYVHTHFPDIAPDKIMVYEDEGFSGGNLNRPAFKSMMEAARKGSFQAVIVYRLDRISRNVSDFSGLIEELTRLETAFVSIREQFDTGTPMGRAMMYIASVFSQLERETIAERIRDNMQELAKTGRWLGGTTPTGYASEAVKSVAVDGKAKSSCRLKLIPEEAELIRLIYDLYEETDSQTMTEAELIRRGIKTKNGKYFTRFSIKAILQNPVYMIADQEAYDYFVRVQSELCSERAAFDGVHGMMVYNRTSQEKGKATEYLPPEEWIVSVGLHPGIISGRVWVKVQESMERNKVRSYHKSRINEALLTGVLYCSCGSRMYPKLSRRTAADGRKVCTYVCRLKEHSRHTACDQQNVNGNVLDGLVLQRLKMLEEDRDAFLRQLKQRGRELTGDQVDCGKRLMAMRQEKTEVEKKIEALVDSLVDLDGREGKMYVVKRIEQLNRECLEMELRIQELEGRNLQQISGVPGPDGMCQLLAQFKAGIEEMTVEQKRAAVRAMVRQIVWDGRNAQVILFGAAKEEGKAPVPETHL